MGAMAHQGVASSTGCRSGYGIELKGGEKDKYFARKCTDCIKHCCDGKDGFIEEADSWQFHFSGRKEHECTCHAWDEAVLKSHRWWPSMRSNRCDDPRAKEQVLYS